MSASRGFWGEQGNIFIYFKVTTDISIIKEITPKEFTLNRYNYLPVTKTESGSYDYTMVIFRLLFISKNHWSVISVIQFASATIALYSSL